VSSHTPDEQPAFDFDNFQVLEDSKEKPAVYDPERIAENVIWPLVDAKWDGDFRQDSMPAMQQFCLPKVGVYAGRILEVTLQAGCDIDWRPEQQNGSTVSQRIMIHDASIRIEERTPDNFETLLEIFKERQPESYAEILNDDGELDLEMDAITGFNMYLDSFGGISSRAFYALKDKDGIEVWSTDDDEVDSNGDLVGYPDDEEDEREEIQHGDADFLTPGGELYVHDIDLLLTASAILNAPDSIVGYLQKIKKYPDLAI
jgi:hypothetical protein